MRWNEDTLRRAETLVVIIVVVLLAVGYAWSRLR